MAKTYQITEAARGVFRVSGQRIGYDVEPGVITADELDPRVLERLKRLGIVAPVKKTPKEEAEQ